MALRHRHFGSKSEMTSPDQTSLFDEADAESEELPADKTTVRGHQRKCNGRPRLAEDLPRVDVVHDLDEADRFCDTNGCIVFSFSAELAWATIISF